MASMRELCRAQGEAERRVVADALLERGDPLGQLVNVQYELARTPPGLEAAKLREVETGLLHAHGSTWTEGLPPGSYGFVGGVIERVGCAASTWQEAHARIRERTAVRALSLWGSMGDGATLASPALAGLAELEVLFQLLEQHLDPFLSGDHLAELCVLRLRGAFFGDAHARALARNPAAAELERLDVESVVGPAGLTRDGLGELLAAFEPSREIRLSRCAVVGEEADALVDRGLLQRRVCDLGGFRLGAAQVRRLVGSPTFSRVSELGLPAHRIGDDGALALAGGAMEELGSLRVTGVIEEYGDRSLRVGNTGYRALCRSERLGGLRSFAFGFGTAVDEESSGAIWAAPFLPQLTRLTLLGAGDARAFERALRAGALAGLEALVCSHVDDGALGALCEAELPKLRELDLSSATLEEPTLVERARARFGTILETEFPYRRPARASYVVKTPRQGS